MVGKGKRVRGKRKVGMVGNRKRNVYSSMGVGDRIRKDWIKKGDR